MVYIYQGKHIDILWEKDRLWINKDGACILRIQGLAGPRVITETIKYLAHSHPPMFDIKILPCKSEET